MGNASDKITTDTAESPGARIGRALARPVKDLQQRVEALEHWREQQVGAQVAHVAGSALRRSTTKIEPDWRAIAGDLFEHLRNAALHFRYERDAALYQAALSGGREVEEFKRVAEQHGHVAEAYEAALTRYREAADEEKGVGGG